MRKGNINPHIGNSKVNNLFQFLFGIYLNQFFKQRVRTVKCFMWYGSQLKMKFSGTTAIPFCSLYQKQFVFPEDSWPQKGTGPLYRSTFLPSMLSNGGSNSALEAAPGFPWIWRAQLSRALEDPWFAASLLLLICPAQVRTLGCKLGIAILVSEGIQHQYTLGMV